MIILRLSIQISILWPNSTDCPNWLFTALPDCCGYSLPVGLQSSCHCDANLGELRCKCGTGVVVVHIKIIALDMELLNQCKKYTGCLAKISVDQLCLLPIINARTLQVPWLTLTQHVHLDAPRVRFTLQVLPEGDTTFKEITDLSIVMRLGCVLLQMLHRDDLWTAGSSLSW